MRRFALVMLLVLTVGLAVHSTAQAAETQVVEVLIGKILENYTVPTEFGNVYFNQRDLHRLVHAAAHLRPIVLGAFTTDQGHLVRVNVKRFDRGMVTMVIVR